MLVFASGPDRTYNRATTTNEVAAIIPDGEDPDVHYRDTRVPYRAPHGVYRISDLHKSYDPLHFPLLFPYGEDGWHPDIPLHDDYDEASQHGGNADLLGRDIEDIMGAENLLANGVEADEDAQTPHQGDVERIYEKKIVEVMKMNTNTESSKNVILMKQQVDLAVSWIKMMQVKMTIKVTYRDRKQMKASVMGERN